MDITYLGHSSFLLKSKQVTVVTDPYDDSMLGFKFPKVSADIVTVSHEHKDHNMTSAVSEVKHVFSGAGEYEAMGVSMISIPTFHDKFEGKERGSNNVFVFEMDGLRIAHLGDLGHRLSEKQVDKIGEIDILFLPVGDFYTIGPDVAVDVMGDIDPFVTIPMHYKIDGMNEELFKELKDVKAFLGSAGLVAESLPRLSINKDTMGEDSRVVVLEKK